MPHLLSLFFCVIALSVSLPVHAASTDISRYEFAVEMNYSALENGKSDGRVHHDYPLARDSDFAYLHQKGIRHIRLPVKWERLQKEPGAPLDKKYLSHIRDALDKAKRNNLTVTLDLHNYGGYRGDKIGGGKITKVHFANLWSRLAREFANDTTITVYDLMNEPAEMPSKDVWPEAAQAAIDIIRTIDKTKIIMVEGNHYSGAFHWEQNNPNIHKLHDPEGKIVFSAHAYLDRNNSGTHYNWKEEQAAGDALTFPKSKLDTNIGVKRVTPFVEWLKKHNLRGNIGELGVGDDHPDWNAALDKTLAYLKENNVSLTYWNAGPWFDKYPYSAGPRKGEPDRPQWDVLQKYTAKNE